jgi:putative Holliday junction resolvase
MSELPFTVLSEFAQSLPPFGRLVALDVGETTIGIAVSDERRQIASPQMTLYRSQWSKDAESLMAMFENQQIVGVVIGYPLNMDGSAGPRAQSVRAFARNLRGLTARPILLWDERLSTAAVTRLMEKEADLSRARRDALVDKLAASYLLQGALDGLHHHG